MRNTVRKMRRQKKEQKKKPSVIDRQSGSSATFVVLLNLLAIYQNVLIKLGHFTQLTFHCLVQTY